MEDMEMRILAAACDVYMQEKVQQPEDSNRVTPLQSIMNVEPKEPKEAKDFFSQIIVAKFFASIYEKRVWKRRLVIITQSMVLVMKRPSDHYLKNAIVLKEMKPAVAMPFTEEVVTRIDLLFCRIRVGLQISMGKSSRPKVSAFNSIRLTT